MEPNVEDDIFIYLSSYNNINKRIKKIYKRKMKKRKNVHDLLYLER